MPAKTVQPGKYLVTFNVKLVLKDIGHVTKRVTRKINVKEAIEEKELARDEAEDYVSETFHEYHVDQILGVSQVKVVKNAGRNLRNIPNRQQKLQYKAFPADAVFNRNDGQCVLDMIMASAAKRWPTFTRAKLIRELEAVAEEEEKNFVEEGVTVRHLMAWAREKKSVSCWALTPLMEVFEYVVSKHPELNLHFVCNNEHVYPIVDQREKDIISQTKQLSFTDVAMQLGTEDYEYFEEDDAIFDSEAKVVHVNTTDLADALRAVVAETGHIPVGVQTRDSFVTAFQHPVTDQIFMASKDFLLRKHVAEESLKETNYIGFLWKNQSWGALWNAWIECKIGTLPMSTYSRESLRIRELYPHGGYIGMVREVTDEEREQVVSFDITKCYTASLLQNEHDFPVESVFDDVEPITPQNVEEYELPVGKAYVDKSFSLGALKFSLGFYPSFFVDYCLDEGAISPQDVTLVQRASRVIPGKQFRKLVEHLQDKFDTAKKLINHGVGAWGRRMQRSGKMAVTDSATVALGMVSQDPSIELTDIGPFWFMRKETKETLMHGHIGLREHVVCMGHIQLHEMQKKVCDENSEVICVNTDSIKVLRPRADFTPVVKKDSKPGDITLEDKIVLRGRIIAEQRERPRWEHERRSTDLLAIEAAFSRPGMKVVGQPGFGKSYMLQQLWQEDKEEELVSEKLAWTKTAALNIGGETLDHVFPQTATRDDWVNKGIKYDVLNIDEFTIVPEKWWSLFLQLKLKKPSLRFRFFGDPMQLHAQDYDTHSRLWYAYDKSDLMNFLTDGNNVQLSYVEATARYDADMKARLDNFEKTRTLAAFDDGTFDPAADVFNIVKTAGMRTKINDQWVKALAPAKTTKVGKMQLWVGAYVISFSNSAPIVNSTRYRVDALGDEIKLRGGGKVLTVPKKVVANTCSYGYADTVMRIISRTIPGYFNIWETDKMDWNEMFVALSRARTAAHIGMDFEGKSGSAALLKKYKLAAPPAKGIRIKLEPELRLGFIYRRTDGEREYIGSTWDMEAREEEHQSNPVSKKCASWQDAQGAKIKMEMVESWMCLNEKQLVSREYELIARVPEDKCMNTNGVAKAAKKEAETKIEKLEIEHERFKIVDDEKEKAWRINWKEDGKLKNKKMRYQRRGKEVTLKEMEEFRMELIKKTFL